MDRAGRCELHYRALEGDLAGVLKRIAAGGSPCAADAQSWTPLHFAAQEQRAEVTETLLRAGAEVDARDAYGNTPLWRAVFTSRGQGRSSVIYWPPGRILISPTRPVSAHDSWRSALQTTTLRSSFRRAPDDCLVPLTVRIWPMSG
ncbi:MAG: hypothetical protein QOF10_2296 [Kribbellaceae bacterium]|nr:hypothetical protein [Kribbellaceae bacterium]